jgi:hypothetical protein
MAVDATHSSGSPEPGRRTSDSGGRTVTRGLQPQAPIAFTATSPSAPTTITVNENTRYQTFEGAGASITDTTAYLLRGGPVSAATRDAAMRKRAVRALSRVPGRRNHHQGARSRLELR